MGAAAVLETILPAGVESEECFGQASGGALFAAEEEVVAHAVEQRRREYAAVRHCARACLARLGYARQPILPGFGGAPVWPVGVLGSMTHCTGYVAAAVAPAARVASIGIDAEPDASLPEGVLEVVGTPAERDRLSRTPAAPGAPAWDRLTFCAKEAVYKAWFPMVAAWLDAQDVEILLHPTDGTFTAVLAREGLVVDGSPVRQLAGRWTRGHGILLTAVVLPAGGARRELST